MARWVPRRLPLCRCVTTAEPPELAHSQPDRWRHARKSPLTFPVSRGPVALQRPPGAQAIHLVRASVCFFTPASRACTPATQSLATRAQNLSARHHLLPARDLAVSECFARERASAIAALLARQKKRSSDEQVPMTWDWRQTVVMRKQWVFVRAWMTSRSRTTVRVERVRLRRRGFRQPSASLRGLRKACPTCGRSMRSRRARIW